ncbi:MAG TPA: hypothetical protein VJ417_10040 [Candidatus Glassbacteria bacterium]|nr:hypothetical protein [Candidatus Glassbacteria bacterium]
MKVLTIIISSDLEHEVAEIISDHNLDCYVKLSEAYGISHRCEGTIGDDLPWEASVLIVAGEQPTLEKLADSILERTRQKDYKPCVRMMLQPVQKVWM